MNKKIIDHLQSMILTAVDADSAVKATTALQNYIYIIESAKENKIDLNHIPSV